MLGFCALLLATNVLGDATAPGQPTKQPTDAPTFDEESHPFGPNLCKDNPCLNGGTCRSMEQVSSYQCACKLPFTGNNCEKQLECKEKGCNGRGECIETETQSRCKCRMPYFGWNCQNDGSSCVNGKGDSKFCSGNGQMILVAPPKYCECRCGSGFKGATCESLRDDTSIEASTYGWGYTALLIIGMIAAVVVVERVWRCGRKAVLKMQGRDGFRAVSQQTEEEYERSQLGEFGGDEEVEMDVLDADEKE